MATYTPEITKKGSNSSSEAEKYEFQYKKDYQEDWDLHRNYIHSFDAYEAMLIGQVYDSVSNSIDGSKITDSYAATLAIERAARVMGKLPDGTTEATPKADQGKAAFMDILRQKWIYPNANAQHSFKIKLRMWQLYSDVYGYMPMFYDWNVSSTGYVGPDCWLWSPRNLIPQQGRTSIADMDYVTALTWVGKKFIDGLLEKDHDGLKETGWNVEALQLLSELAQNTKSDVDLEKDTKIARDRVPQATRKGICLATRYEAGEDGNWCTFAPDHGYIQVRELPNPHKNGRIPFVIKYGMPLFDSFYGLGDFQRAKPLQFARDGLTNFYFKGIKINLVQPIVVNANGVVKHTVDYREGGVIQETIPNSVRVLGTSNAGLSTYQAAQTSLTGSLLSLYGSQNASIPGADALNPSQGKTPAAIGLYSDKEATRDGQEREMLENAMEELTDGFFSLVANIGTEDIPVNLFSDDLEEIKDAGLSDVMEMFKKKFSVNSTETGGELKIAPAALKGVDYRFHINFGSTAKMNKDAQRQALEEFVGVIGKLQNVLQDDPRVQIDWPQIMKSYEGLTDIPGVSKFMSFNPDAQKQPEPTAQTATSVPIGSQVHESADLVKLYLGTEDPELQAQILQAMGFQPTQGEPAQPAEQTPATATSQGHLYQDSDIGAAAEKLGSAGVESPPATEPTVNAAGAFHDPTLAAAGHEITKL